jgi:hypothetical protein
MALSMRTAAIAAAVKKVEVLRTRLRAEAPSRSSASCSPSCSGLVAPAARAVSVNRSAKALLSSWAYTRAGWPGSWISTDAAMKGPSGGWLSKAARSRFAGYEVGAVEYLGQDVGIESAGTYADPEAGLPSSETVNFAHSLGETVTAAIQAGLHIDSLTEYVEASKAPRPPLVPREADGCYRLRLDGQPLPAPVHAAGDQNAGRGLRSKATEEQV